MTDHEDDLPRIGDPARRALEAAGISRLAQVADHRADDLAALHGVGPTAITRLRAALAERGLSFAGGAGPRVSAEAAAFIAQVPDPDRPLFDRLHALILDERPDADVVISYGIPLYKVGKRHVGLNPRRVGGVTLTTTSPDHIEAFRRRHPGFRTNVASIRFDRADDLPEADVREVIRRATSA